MFYYRWNSLYDSVVVLLEVLSIENQLDAINTILINQPKGGSTITEVDIQVSIEYERNDFYFNILT